MRPASARFRPDSVLSSGSGFGSFATGSGTARQASHSGGPVARAPVVGSYQAYLRTALRVGATPAFGTVHQQTTATDVAKKFRHCETYSG